ncbi:nicotinamide N-methyltransferase-like protein [Phanerochaete sordida]|uniref:Protein N-terminal and lysine N-methyltransferase EFM7 n=1 Tax=Phanerochaete sordida TaxID=48140 RepID=A0A9P3L913_9APHY|nr:nicotinamide N-methyltransferase-like protein [Phanerochaete sordida]
MTSQDHEHASGSDDEGGLDLDSVFLEPPRPPSPEPTISTYTRALHSSTLTANHGVWSDIEIRLVGSHPLWGHYLWNAARSFASYLDAHPELYRNGSVLELGAGGGLPGLITAKNHAKCVILTDYPDKPLLDNLTHNVERNASTAERNTEVMGYIWGQSLKPIFEAQQKLANTRGFDLIIMSDLIFNHSQHDALLKTAEDALRTAAPGEPHPPCVLVFYSHHRPHLAHRDMEFFSKAEERGWKCEEIVTEKFPPMFPEDPGEEEVRATVHGWRLTRAAS